MTTMMSMIQTGLIQSLAENHVQQYGTMTTIKTKSTLLMTTQMREMVKDNIGTRPKRETGLSTKRLMKIQIVMKIMVTTRTITPTVNMKTLITNSTKGTTTANMKKAITTVNTKGTIIMETKGTTLAIM